MSAKLMSGQAMAAEVVDPVRPSKGSARFRTVAAAVLGLALAAPAHAADVKVDYAISLIGLTIGSANLQAKVDANRYDLAMQAKLTGLAGAVTGGRGAATATGTLAGGRIAPQTFAVTSQAGEDSRTVRMAVAGNVVQAVEIVPPLEEKPDRVPVKPVHKRGVLDPMGALLMPVASRVDVTDPSVCNRTIPIFDGASRFDVVLSSAGTKDVETPGYKGKVAVCRARYVPVAGHRPERPATKFMVENRDMEAWLLPVGKSRFFLPLRVSIKTMIGTTVLEATRFAVDGAELPIEPASAED